MRTKALIRYTYGDSRNAFSYPEDTYEGWVILAAESGKFEFVIHGEKEADSGIAVPGDLIFCPPGLRLQRQILETLSFHFFEFVSDHTWPFTRFKIHDRQRLQSTFDYLREIGYLAPRTGDAQSNAQDLRHLLEDLLFIVEREHAYSDMPPLKSGEDPLMTEAAALIGMRACEGTLSLQLLAQQLGLSASQFTRRFQRAFGLSPVQHASHVRMEKACRLLVETDATLEEIAERCGYQNGFYFSRVFSKHMKVTPSSYRLANRI